MKTYYAPGRLRIVGKAWEVRFRLRQMTKEAGGDMMLETYLSKRSGKKRPLLYRIR